MINRRSLRIKAFKNLYSFESCKGANFLIGLDIINKKFSPDLNSMEVVDKEELKRKKALAIKDYEHHFDQEKEGAKSNPEVAAEVKEAVDYVKKQNIIDLKRLLNDLLEEASRVTKDHLYILSLLEELAFQNKKLSDEKKSLGVLLGEKVQTRTNLYDNKVLKKFNSHNVFLKLKNSYKINWTNHEDQLRCN